MGAWIGVLKQRAITIATPALCHSKQSESVGSRFAESNAGNHAVARMHVGIMPRRMVVPGRSRRLTPRPIVDHDIEDSRLAAFIAELMHAIRRKEQRISCAATRCSSALETGSRPTYFNACSMQ
ncbi:hypothetical protein [Diaphorobacter sp. ED-3]|uniref:hypothetical protein n=1 Tax=Diaphorobacter sp. ED-3 TaxID=3016636 RepID=UPI0022DE5824|nr:hypothetical protein [Diaphorobacter sp. ED-3]